MDLALKGAIMSITAAELAGLFLLLFGVFYWLGIFAKARAVLAFLGAVTLGVSGHFGSLIASVFTWVSNAFGAITAWALGVAVTGGLAVVLIVVLIHDLHPKKPAGKRTGFVALAVGMAVAAGVASLPVLASISGLVVQLMDGIASALSSL
jgi:hypothetical protein